GHGLPGQSAAGAPGPFDGGGMLSCYGRGPAAGGAVPVPLRGAGGRGLVGSGPGLAPPGRCPGGAHLVRVAGGRGGGTGSGPGWGTGGGHPGGGGRAAGPAGPGDGAPRALGAAAAAGGRGDGAGALGGLGRHPRTGGGSRGPLAGPGAGCVRAAPAGPRALAAGIGPGVGRLPAGGGRRRGGRPPGRGAAQPPAALPVAGRADPGCRRHRDRAGVDGPDLSPHRAGGSGGGGGVGRRVGRRGPPVRPSRYCPVTRKMTTTSARTDSSSGRNSGAATAWSAATAARMVNGTGWAVPRVWSWTSMTPARRWPKASAKVSA